MPSKDYMPSFGMTYIALLRGNTHGSDCLSIFPAPDLDGARTDGRGTKERFQSNCTWLWSSNTTGTAQSPLLPFQLVSLGNEQD